MAKVLFTAVVADMRGKLAGTVFTKNRGGAVARTKVSPVNARTIPQQVARADFGNFSTAWRSLSQASRDTWNTGAPNFPRKDQFGNTKILSGQQLYVALNSNLSKISLPALIMCPVPQGTSWERPEKVSLAVNAAKLELTAGIGVEPGQATVWYIRATPIMSEGVTNPTGRFKAIANMPIPSVGTGPAVVEDITTEWESVFGKIPGAGSGQIFVEITAINAATGESSAPLIISGVV